MASLACKFCSAALLLTMVIAYGSARLGAAQDRADKVLKNRSDAAARLQSINAERLAPPTRPGGEIPTVSRRVMYNVVDGSRVEIGTAEASRQDTIGAAERIIYSVQSAHQARVAAGCSAEKIVYQAGFDSGFGLFLNYNPATGAAFPGTMLADNLGLGGGFVAGDTISSYELLVSRSVSDPQPGLADFHVELWDGDPFCMIDTPGGGFSCAPIPGAEADFVDIAAGTTTTLRATMLKGVIAPNTRVWMVVSGSETVNPSPCRLGWRVSGRKPEIGNDDPGDFFELQSDDDGLGACCADGSACDVGAEAPCDGDPSGSRGFCSDGDAESAAILNLGGPCTGAPTDFCATFVASVFGCCDGLADCPGTCPAKCPGGEMPTVFRGFDNCALPPATIAIVKDALVVSLGPSPLSATFAAGTAPSGGDEICVGVEFERAGYDGFRIENDDTKIPQDVTDYFVELDGYWGTMKSPEPWITDPIPIGFATAGAKITARADFDVCPIFCSIVEVEFQGGQSPGKIECPSGDLFSVSDSTTVTVRRVVAHGTCPGGTGCSKCTARGNAELQFVLAEVVEGWVVEDPACIVVAGDPPFSASTIRIKPKLADCREESANPPGCSSTASVAACPGTGHATAAQAVGGNTPPMYRLRCLAVGAASSDQTNAAAVPGSFTILDAASCDLQETGAACQDGVDNDCDGPFDCADSDCATDPTCCPPALPPSPESPAIPKNRFITMVPGNAGQLTALEVTLVNLPTPFGIWNGRRMFVTEPRLVTEQQGATTPLPLPNFLTGHLRCTPDCQDWGTLGQIDVFSEAIIAGAEYEVRAVDCACDLLDPVNYSAPLAINTSKYGDMVSQFRSGAWPPPDTTVDVTTDLLAILEGFKGLPTRPRKARTDLVDNCLNLVIDISEIVDIIDAFRGFKYRFRPSSPDPCTALCP